MTKTTKPEKVDPPRSLARELDKLVKKQFAFGMLLLGVTVASAVGVNYLLRD